MEDRLALGFETRTSPSKGTKREKEEEGVGAGDSRRSVVVEDVLKETGLSARGLRFFFNFRGRRRWRGEER